MMKKKLFNIVGFTLIEILIAIVITSLMMAAMFTSYTLVNSTYRQVTDRAKISQAGRDTVGTMLREIRMAGFRYLNDNIAASTQHNPIRIYKGAGFSSGSGSCDKIEIVYGGVDYDSTASEGNRYTYERYKITYECKASIKIDDTIPGGTTPINGFAIYKSREKWNSSLTPPGWSTGTDDTLYKEEQVLDYVQDLVFIPYDENGKPITSIGTYTPSDNDTYDVRTVDIGLVIRSSKPFFKQDKAGTMARKIVSIATTASSGPASARNIVETDKYLRDTITVTANARNVGLD
jgi:prepilin-type N-terminal cleavage/methylation domain-containing protein